MIFNYYSSYYSLATLREFAKINKEGTTVFGLVETIRKLNYQTKAIKSDISLFETKEIVYP